MAGKSGLTSWAAIAPLWRTFSVSRNYMRPTCPCRGSAEEACRHKILWPESPSGFSPPQGTSHSGSPRQGGRQGKASLSSALKKGKQDILPKSRKLNIAHSSLGGHGEA